MAQPFVGQVIAVGFNFAPPGWLLCNGSVVPIAEFEPLYNLIGTTYGGNGQTTFALPDLRGRAPLGMGQGPGLSNYVLGQQGGVESVALASNQFASHTHALQAAATATTSTPGSTVVLGTPDAATTLYAPSRGTTTLAPGAVSMGGGSGQPHENRQPSATINYIIAWAGIYPTQS
jgi:microcystin-dependent protein